MDLFDCNETMEMAETTAFPDAEMEILDVFGVPEPKEEASAEAIPNEPAAEPEAEESPPKKKRASRKKVDTSIAEELPPDGAEEIPALELADQAQSEPAELLQADTPAEPVLGLGPPEEDCEPPPPLEEVPASEPVLEEPKADEIRPPEPRGLEPRPREGRMAKGQHSPLLSLKLNQLDRELTEEERAEWNEIYASFRSKSVLTGRIVGVDEHAFHVRDQETGELKRRRLFCAVVIPYRVKILIPETEMWTPGRERPSHVLRNMTNAEIDYVILDVDREGGVAIASRRLGMAARQHFFDSARSRHEPGERLTCNVLAVGPSQCLVECGGRDISLRYQDMSYSSYSDLRENYHPGETLNCVLKDYDRARDQFLISVKEAYPNPFDGVPARHPLGSRRQAVISGKYGGGVFCTMPDGTTCLCLYAPQHSDREFQKGDTVILAINKYDYERCLVYGRILAKW
ncbi:MAG: hypothetical protein HFF18_14390 [Oscillospiraceae bacterium]|nr:hypothetical protein [Oscillospiraceae bacterium]